jgi:hypothetical protein
MNCRRIRSTDREALVAISALHNRVFPGRDLDTERVAGYIQKFPYAATVLEDGDGIRGYFLCIPIGAATFSAARLSEIALEDLSPYALSDPEVTRHVLDGDGNYCFVKMFAYDPKAGVEDFGGAAMCLFEDLKNLFRRIRMRAVICRSQNRVEVEVIQGVGCKKACDLDQDRTVWYFDAECFPDNPRSQLGSLFHQLWLAEQRLNLTPRQRQVLACRVGLNQSEGEAADLLGVSPSAIRQACNKARTRCNDQAIGLPVFLNTDDLSEYCRKNPVELAVPGSLRDSKLTNKM